MNLSPRDFLTRFFALFIALTLSVPNSDRGNREPVAGNGSASFSASRALALRATGLEESNAKPALVNALRGSAAGLEEVKTIAEALEVLQSYGRKYKNAVAKGGEVRFTRIQFRLDLGPTSGLLDYEQAAYQTGDPYSELLSEVAALSYGDFRDQKVEVITESNEERMIVVRPVGFTQWQGVMDALRFYDTTRGQLSGGQPTNVPDTENVWEAVSNVDPVAAKTAIEAMRRRLPESPDGSARTYYASLLSAISRAEEALPTAGLEEGAVRRWFGFLDGLFSRPSSQSPVVSQNVKWLVRYAALANRTLVPDAQGQIQSTFEVRLYPDGRIGNVPEGESTDDDLSLGHFDFEVELVSNPSRGTRRFSTSYWSDLGPVDVGELRKIAEQSLSQASTGLEEPDQEGRPGIQRLIIIGFDGQNIEHLRAAVKAWNPAVTVTSFEGVNDPDPEFYRGLGASVDVALLVDTAIAVAQPDMSVMGTGAAGFELPPNYVQEVGRVLGEQGVVVGVIRDMSALQDSEVRTMLDELNRQYGMIAGLQDLLGRVQNYLSQFVDPGRAPLAPARGMQVTITWNGGRWLSSLSDGRPISGLFPMTEDGINAVISQTKGLALVLSKDSLLDLPKTAVIAGQMEIMTEGWEIKITLHPEVPHVGLEQSVSALEVKPGISEEQIGEFIQQELNAGRLVMVHYRLAGGDTYSYFVDSVVEGGVRVRTERKGGGLLADRIRFANIQYIVPVGKYQDFLAQPVPMLRTAKVRFLTSVLGDNSTNSVRLPTVATLIQIDPVIDSVYKTSQVTLAQFEEDVAATNALRSDPKTHDTDPVFKGRTFSLPLASVIGIELPRVPEPASVAAGLEEKISFVTVETFENNGFVAFRIGDGPILRTALSSDSSDVPNLSVALNESGTVRAAFTPTGILAYTADQRAAKELAAPLIPGQLVSLEIGQQRRFFYTGPFVIHISEGDTLFSEHPQVAWLTWDRRSFYPDVTNTLGGNRNIISYTRTSDVRGQAQYIVTVAAREPLTVQLKPAAGGESLTARLPSTARFPRGPTQSGLEEGQQVIGPDGKIATVHSNGVVGISNPAAAQGQERDLVHPYGKSDQIRVTSIGFDPSGQLLGVAYNHPLRNHLALWDVTFRRPLAFGDLGTEGRETSVAVLPLSETEILSRDHVGQFRLYTVSRNPAGSFLKFEDRKLDPSWPTNAVYFQRWVAAIARDIREGYERVNRKGSLSSQNRESWNEFLRSDLLQKTRSMGASLVGEALVLMGQDPASQDIAKAILLQLYDRIDRVSRVDGDADNGDDWDIEVSALFGHWSEDSQIIPWMMQAGKEAFLEGLVSRWEGRIRPGMRQSTLGLYAAAARNRAVPVDLLAPAVGNIRSNYNLQFTLSPASSDRTVRSMAFLIDQSARGALTAFLDRGINIGEGLSRKDVRVSDITGLEEDAAEAGGFELTDTTNLPGWPSDILVGTPMGYVGAAQSLQAIVRSVKSLEAIQYLTAEGTSSAFLQARSSNPRIPDADISAETQRIAPMSPYRQVSLEVQQNRKGRTLVTVKPVMELPGSVAFGPADLKAMRDHGRFPTAGSPAVSTTPWSELRVVILRPQNPSEPSSSGLEEAQPVNRLSLMNASQVGSTISRLRQVSLSPNVDEAIQARAAQSELQGALLHSALNEIDSIQGKWTQLDTVPLAFLFEGASVPWAPFVARAGAPVGIIVNTASEAEGMNQLFSRLGIPEGQYKVVSLDVEIDRETALGTIQTYFQRLGLTGVKLVQLPSEAAALEETLRGYGLRFNTSPTPQLRKVEQYLAGLA